MAIDEYQRAIRRSRTGEMLLWVAAALLVSLRIWVDLFTSVLTGRASFGEVFSYRYEDFLVAAFLVFFPLLCFQVLGMFPFESLRRQRVMRKKAAFREKRTSEPERGAAKNADTTSRPEADSFRLARALADSSREMAEKIFLRSGIYLIVGVLVAFSGLAFFYTQTPQKEVKWDALLLAMVPRFGILFFIELVAFFFLRQYRSAMDEFRYFEAIKRRREENLLLLVLAKPSASSIDLLQLIELWDFSSTPTTLSGGETTEILEARKLTRDELSLFEKMLDIINVARNKAK